MEGSREFHARKFFDTVESSLVDIGEEDGRTHRRGQDTVVKRKFPASAGYRNSVLQLASLSL
jgi:hypothetical protein